MSRIWLAIALAWIVLARVPLVLNAPTHLDSDLAVDGLTLADATEGRWRWHYPGTPHMGTAPVLLSLPMAAAWGPGPEALVSGGVAAYALMVAATWWLGRRAFGDRAASWSLVPLAAGSTGLVWLSGRITGGHLLTAAWHAAAFAMLFEAIARGGARRAAVLGAWCGLGLWVDSLFAFSLAGLAPAAMLAWWRGGRSRSGLAAAVAWGAALVAGLAPAVIGRRVDPHDAYGSQFASIFKGTTADQQSSLLESHARLLVLECLPRLAAGHRLPDLASAPHPSAPAGHPILAPRADSHPIAWAATAAGLGLFLIGSFALSLDLGAPADDPARAAVRRGLTLSSLLVVVAFLINKNIYDWDNYRYLIFLVVQAALGVGIVLDRVARAGRRGAIVAGLVAAATTATMAADTARWYDRLGWIDGGGRPVRRAMRDPALAALRGRPEVTHVFGDYWDAYRLAYLAGDGRVGVPYPIYPDRFPGWSAGLEPGRGAIGVARPDDPRWPGLLSAAWAKDGRDPAELSRIAVVPLSVRRGPLP